VLATDTEAVSVVTISKRSASRDRWYGAPDALFLRRWLMHRIYEMKWFEREQRRGHERPLRQTRSLCRLDSL